MSGKRLLKRLVFGGLVKMPAEVGPETATQVSPASLAAGHPDRGHKVIFCEARLKPRG
jgi:hypothetical protein